MIIVKIIGGLGNQLFQYALGRHLALLNQTELKLDITAFESYKLHKYSLDAFNIKKNIASKDEIDRFKKYKPKSERMRFLYNMLFADSSKYFQEEGFNFNPEVLKIGGDAYIDGYWQTEKYFKDIESTIRADFSFVLPQSKKDMKILAQIHEYNSVSIHIRRADYVTDAKANKAHGTCPTEYYNKAVDIIAMKVTNPHFFVFSDDHDWVKKNIKINYPTVYVDHNNSDTNYQDLRLMASCKHNIIANSSFSWWGAWLNENPNKIVITPQRWFADTNRDNSDLIPSTWTRI